MGGVDKNQINDSSIVEEAELNSLGLAGISFNTGLAIASVTSITKTIILSSGDVNDPRIQELDIVSIIGGNAEGYYTVDTVINDLIFTVKEVIQDASSGVVHFYYRSGCQITGFHADGANFPSHIKNAQQAIEYAKQNAEGFPRAGLPLIYNGTVSNNAWISYSNLTPDVPIVFPVKTKLNELTWANNSADRSFDLELYKLTGAILTLIATLEVRNSALNFGYWTELPYTFEAGEGLKIKYKDQGLNCLDLCLVPWISRITE